MVLTTQAGLRVAGEPNALPSLAEIRARLRAAGLRSTEARIAVLRRLIEATAPLTHAEVARAIDSQGYDKATIYRNLVELSEAGLVSRIELGDHVWRFELRRSGQGEPPAHPHFVCIDCGEVSCLTGVNVSIVPATDAPGPALGDVTEVLLKGHCQRCR
jgi:Fur family transcriptional regulator, ferric uptake regulator